MDLRSAFIQRLDSARADLESLIPRTKQDFEIYPGWRLKELLDHIAGWDEIILGILESRLSARVPAKMTLSIDDYNVLSLDKRKCHPYSQSLAEFREIRQTICTIILESTEEELSRPINFPWGGQGTFSEIVEIFSDHEEQHTADLLRAIGDSSS